MTQDCLSTPHPALPDDAPTVARLLHDFNREFDIPVPDEAILRRRWEALLSREDVLVLQSFSIRPPSSTKLSAPSGRLVSEG